MSASLEVNNRGNFGASGTTIGRGQSASTAKNRVKCQELQCAGPADLSGGSAYRARPLSTTTTIGRDDSGTTFLVTQSGVAATYTLPNPPIEGLSYRFFLGTASTANITITDGTTHLFGHIINDVTSVLSMNAVTSIVFTGSGAAIGDMIEITGVDSTHYVVHAVTSTAGGVAFVA